MPQIPKPFKRPRVEVSLVKKDWIDVPVACLTEGDMVRGKGKIILVSDSPRGIRVEFLSGEILDLEEGDTLNAFVEVR